MTKESSSSEDYSGVRGIVRAFGSPASLTMLFLGFGSGLPFLLVGVTLAIWQREVGFTLTDIGLMSAASWLYLLKFLWAPLLDRYPLPFLGRRRGWLLLSQIGVAVFLAAMAVLGPKNVEFVFVLLMVGTSFFGATQDIVVDAYRIEIAPPSAQAALAAMSTLGYRIALITAGAGALYVANFFDWRTAYAVMALLMLLPMIATLTGREPNVDQETYQETRRLNFAQAFSAPFAEFFTRHGALLATALLIFVGLFKFPDQVIGVIAGPFYLDSGFTKLDIANVSKLYGVWIGIFGAFLGGVGVAVIGVRPMLLIAAFAVAGSNIAFLLMAQNPGQIWAFYAAISADNISQGLAGVVLVAFMATLTHPAHTATQFALLVSLAFLPGKLASAISGYLIEMLGYANFFLMSTVTVIPALLLLLWLWPRIGNEMPRKPTVGPTLWRRGSMKGQIVEFEDMPQEERVRAFRWVVGKAIKHPSVWVAFSLQVLGFFVLLQLAKSVTPLPVRLLLVLAYVFLTLSLVRSIYQKKQNWFVKVYLAENPQLQK